MATIRATPFACLTLAFVTSVTAHGAAQDAPTPAPPEAPAAAAPAPAPTPAPAPPAPAEVAPPAPAAAAAAPETPEALAEPASQYKKVEPIFPPPVERPPTPKREKLQATTIGMRLGAVDFGAEADVVSAVGRLKPAPDNRRWTYAMRGFFRAPMRVGIGPETGYKDGSQLHSPPRMVGFHSDEWDYIGIAPAGQGQIELAVSNTRVEGHVILAGDVFVDAAYPHLDKMGGFSQAWVTLKSPALIGTRGGAALNVGAFSERFGAAGPFQQSTGYYGTYLFGRTHVAGESLVLDFDITPDLQLIVEHGLGAKVEVIPYQKDGAPIAPYLPNQGPTPQGSNFVHHAHLNLIFGEWLSVAGHYLTSWTPNDLQEIKLQAAKEGRLSVFGGEVHVDHPVAGNGYLGYSYVDAKRIMPLSDGVQLLHSSVGWNFKENYFGKMPADLPGIFKTGDTDVRRDDTGSVQTILAQYILRAAPLFGRKEPGPDVALAVFGMLNHVEAEKHELDGVLVPEYELKQDKIKFGGELQVAPIEPLSLGLRFDRVMPDGGNDDVAYSAISPRVVLHSKWIGREYVILNYTRFFAGDQVRPSAPYTQPRPAAEPFRSVTKPDENLISLTAMVAF